MLLTARGEGGECGGGMNMGEVNMLLYNPMSLVQPGRAEEIKSEAKNMDIIFLPGTSTHTQRCS